MVTATGHTVSLHLIEAGGSRVRCTTSLQVTSNRSFSFVTFLSLRKSTRIRCAGSTNMPAQTNLAAARETANNVAPAQHSSKPAAPPNGAVACLRAHWPEYAMEAGLLGAFM